MYRSVLFICAVFGLFLTIIVSSDETRNVYEFCSNFLSERESHTMSSTDQQSQGSPTNQDSINANFKKEIEYLKERIEVVLKAIPADEMESIACTNTRDLYTGDLYTVSSQNREKESNCGEARIEECWSPEKDDKKPWIQQYFDDPERVVGISNKPPEVISEDEACVLSYTISYGNSTDDLKPINDEEGNIMKFSGDRRKPITHKLDKPVVCQYVRLYPVEWCKIRAMQMDVFTSRFAQCIWME